MADLRRVSRFRSDAVAKNSGIWLTDALTQSRMSAPQSPQPGNDNTEFLENWTTDQSLFRFVRQETPLTYRQALRLMALAVTLVDGFDSYSLLERQRIIAHCHTSVSCDIPKISNLLNVRHVAESNHLENGGGNV